MRYLSVCSGIEAATVGWHPLGWTPAAFSEIEPFPRAVLAHHYPDVPLHGDFTTIQCSEYGPVDLLVGGTPCQSFSVAGLRRGLADERGNLALEFLRLAQRTGARWLVWENVPGVLSSNGGRDFGAFLGGLVELGYGFAYRVLDAQYVRVDGYPRAVPQRRRRVFVVGHLGDWRRAAAVLFERESLSGHPAPRREARERAAPTLAARTRGGGGLGTDFDCDGGVIVAPEVAAVLETTCHDYSRADGFNMVAHSLRADGFDASEDGTVSERQQAIAFDTTQITSKANRSNPKAGDPCHPLAAGAHPPAIAIQERAICENPDAGPDGAGIRTDGAAYTLESRTVPQAVAFSCKDWGHDVGEVSPTLRGMGCDDSHANGGGQVAVAFPSHFSNHSVESTGVSPTLTIGSGVDIASPPAVQYGMAVRRLTPRECERLQGFPDDYTLAPYRGKPASDGPRYKALGNSMAVNVMRWIGQRIAAVEAIP